ncbi:MAG: radical SAM protein [Nanoarchaeota archaeon]
MKKKIFFLSTENGCNNNCIGCADNNFNRHKNKNGRSLNEIKKDLKEGVNAGFEILHIAGGEFTIQDNIFDILDLAKKSYDEIFITSNGRMFSNLEFSKNIAKYNLNQINITLAGKDSKTHDLWTNVEGSFNQVIKGIINLKNLNQKININLLYWKQDYNQVYEMLELLKKLGVDTISIFNLVPLGKAKPIFKELTTTLKQQATLENQVKKSNLSNVTFEDFPYCIFSKEFLEEITIINTSGMIYKNELGQVINYSLFVARENNVNIESNLKFQEDVKGKETLFKEYRKKIEVCNNCSKKNLCKGVFEKYIEDFGKENVEKELKLLMEENLK